MVEQCGYLTPINALRNLLDGFHGVHECAASGPAHLFPDVELRYFLLLFLVELVLLLHELEHRDFVLGHLLGLVGAVELIH